MGVFEPCETATQPTHIGIRLSDQHSNKIRVTRTFLFMPGRHLRFNRVLAILSPRFDLALVLARSGIVSSSMSRQLDKLHAEGVAQDILRYFMTNSKVPRCQPLRLHPHP